MPEWTYILVLPALLLALFLTYKLVAWGINKMLPEPNVENFLKFIDAAKKLEELKHELEKDEKSTTDDPALREYEEFIKNRKSK